jgi:hypothetical protein
MTPTLTPFAGESFDGEFPPPGWSWLVLSPPPNFWDWYRTSDNPHSGAYSIALTLKSPHPFTFSTSTTLHVRLTEQSEISFYMLAVARPVNSGGNEGGEVFIRACLNGAPSTCTRSAAAGSGWQRAALVVPAGEHDISWHAEFQNAYGAVQLDSISVVPATPTPTPTSTPTPVCGDTKCHVTERCTCMADCGPRFNYPDCPQPCGDDVCNYSEHCTCEYDCGPASNYPLCAASTP